MLKLNKRAHVHSLCNFLEKNRRGQVATTITWIVATIIIIVILGISMLITAALGKRAYNDNDLNERTDLLITKSLLSYLLTKDLTNKNIFEQISEDGNLNNFNGNLAKSIFFGLYERNYKIIWLVVLKPEITHNIYFPKPCVIGNHEDIELTGNKKISLAFTRTCR